MRKRLLKNAKTSYSNISKNLKYQFSRNYALSIYPLEAIYTFIPKNACSTLRYSTAVANGFLSNIEDVEWIHQNNRTFIATQQEICRAKYTFVILRCPYRRLASCFINKFVDGEFNFKGADGKPYDANFSQFVELVARMKREEMNEHWRHQCDFLHYEVYDDYFCLEKFNVAIKNLKDKGFDVIDTRRELKHDISALSKETGDYSTTPISVIKDMKRDGYVPTVKSLYSGATYGIIENVYKEDIDLYSVQIGEQNILRL